MGRKEYIATCYSDLVKDIIKIRLHICRNWKKKDCPREEEDMKCPNQEEDNSKKSTVRTGVAYKREDRREQKKKSIQ